MKKLLFFISSLIIVSCSNKVEVKKPEKLIEKETMENILYDLALLQALKGHSPQSLAKNEINAKTYIYQKYKIDSLQFVESNRYYSADVQNYMQMFDKVIKRLDTEKKAANEVVKKETAAKQKRRKDSIAKASKN
ncbi:DUF4296 domain-containing protein [Flavobacterium amniphilum]|uniref:DUF4296 domain-containing protein n=1 Tax=Flavobacterium amniphilum TaxID=1834035 RepID=UPI00202A19B8|nr:DUF4296 domain-containing protein [Flavobacterium amniphilum]MCL9806039.1 DUF4296 domain-containing protein [Flavobacterium amniphilum]